MNVLVFLGERVLIVVWQTGSLERWYQQFRRPITPRNSPTTPTAPPARPNVEETQQVQAPDQGGVSALTTFFHVAEQILFVFVASLWPNAIGGGQDPAPEDLAEPARQGDGAVEVEEN
jgi:hypothetical protein